jgi:hypothetical protein
VLTVVVPAHDEERVIGRLLGRLTEADRPDAPALRILVVANGCSDRTAELSRTFPGVTVLETPQACKAAALRLGDLHAEGFPRLYVDADVELSAASAHALADALTRPGILAVAPARAVLRHGASRWVGWYYDVWEALPAVRAGLFGRGVIGLRAEGHERISALPSLMSDDLGMSSAFRDGERLVVPHAQVVVHPPRTCGDLVRRRIRAATGTAQAYGEAQLATDSRTTGKDLLAVVRARPALLLRMPVFLAVAVIARRRARRAISAGDYATWLRDESSRSDDGVPR